MSHRRAEAPTDPWLLRYDGFDPAAEGLREALCATGNGYLATRGAAPEATADGVHYPGTYVAGVYNRLCSDVAGRTLEHESLVNIPNWLPLTFRIAGGAWFDIGDVELEDHRQQLDLRRGVLTRRLVFRDGDGRRTGVTQRRITSMAEPHIAALETTIQALDWSGAVDVRSGLDGEVSNQGVVRYRGLRGDHLADVHTGDIDAESIELSARTTQSHVVVALAARTRAHPQEAGRRTRRSATEIGQELSWELEEGEEVTVEKVVAVFTSRDDGISEPALAARSRLPDLGTFDELVADHVVRWGDLWRRCGVLLDDHRPATQHLNLHLFHLLQTVSEHTAELDAGVPARGLHGEAYRGHVFWDELFIFPTVSFAMPELTSALLRYRHRRLPAARRAARAAGRAGAMFPWQSGSDGREESQTWHLNPRSGHWTADNSSLQRHVGSAIAYNVWHHFQTTGDMALLTAFGAELILEIARFWASLAEYDHGRDRYVIRGVMGPDEYHDGYPGRDEPGLDNNAYTNVMAVWVLCRALDVLDRLPEARRRALREALRLGRDELDRWEHISRRMFVPFHGAGIISQFDGYEQLEELDWDAYRRRYGDIQRLDRILEAEGDSPNRYKASKQADVLMLFYLLSAEQLAELFEHLGYPFAYETIPDNIAYYARRTSDGSTLSRLVHSWVLARGDRPGSWPLFVRALESDVRDVQGGTTAEGIHLGAMAGTIDLVQRGYLGIEVRDDVLWLNPRLPDELTSLETTIQYRGHWGIRVGARDGRLSVVVPPSDLAPITVGFEGRLVAVGPGERFDAPLRPAGASR